MMESPLLDIRNLTVSFTTDDGAFNAVEGASFHVNAGEILGLVGESGCGKSVTALSALRLIPAPSGRITSGRILFKGRDLLTAPVREMRAIRGKSVSMIFQEPLSALSPLHRIGRQMTETIRLHEDMSKADARRMAKTWLGKVGIPDPAERMHAYPFQLSGGMRQRVMIAMALMMEPDLIIADEPTTALDVTTQAQVFDLIRRMKDRNASVLLITHDMGVVWEMCDRVAVMYAARIVEQGPREAVFAAPGHPYAKGLLEAIPRLSDRPGRLKTISGQVPPPSDYPAGCRFHDRCPHAFDRCRGEPPPFVDLGGGHEAACFIAGKLHGGALEGSAS